MIITSSSVIGITDRKFNDRRGCNWNSNLCFPLPYLTPTLTKILQTLLRISSAVLFPHARAKRAHWREGKVGLRKSLVMDGCTPGVRCSTSTLTLCLGSFSWISAVINLEVC